MPSDAELARFYATEYRASYKRTLEPKPHHVLRAIRAAEMRVRLLGGALGPGTSVLDVGSGGGEFLVRARDQGCDVQGVEPNTGYREHSIRRHHLDVRASLDEIEGCFDTITLFHVLEHLPQPVKTLQRLAGLLTRNGTLAIEVPNLESTVEHPRSRFHYAHVVYFSAPCLERTAALAGFRTGILGTSPDGGNLWAVFRKGDVPPVAGGAIPGNADRILAKERTRTPMAYYLSARTPLRALRRISGHARDRITAAWR